MAWSSRARAALVGAGLIAIVSSLPATAAAQQQPDVAGAETLFEQGRALMAKGSVDAACAKFAESQRLAPAAGTALNLANCYDKQGKTASAWGMYREAISLSVTSGQAVREQYARDRAAEIEPKLIRLVVTIGSDEPGLEVRRDGTLMTRAQWGTPIPVDPGTHTIEASAPRKKKWTKVVETKGEGSTTMVTVPGLESLPPPPPPPPVTQVIVREKPHDSGGALRVLGFASIAVGAGLLGAGGYFALDSSKKKDDLEQAAQNRETWNADRQASYDDGQNAAKLANVFFVAGGVVLATGAVLTVLGYSKKSDTVVGISPRGGSVAWAF